MYRIKDSCEPTQNAKVNSGNRKAVLASNYTLQLSILGRHVGIKCDLKGINHCSHCVWLAQDLKYKSHLTESHKGLIRGLIYYTLYAA